jgi:hypothetical protein
MGNKSPSLDYLQQLKDDPRDIRNWQLAWSAGIRCSRFLFVRNNADAPWLRVELVQAPNCVVWVCKDRPGSVNISDENCYTFDPATTTFPPFQLTTVGEVRYGRSKTDFQNDGK